MLNDDLSRRPGRGRRRRGNLAAALILTAVAWAGWSSGRAPVVAGDPVTTSAPSASTAIERGCPTNRYARRAKVLDVALAEATPAGVDIAVAVADHRSGHTYELSADVPFETASIVKVQILAALLLSWREDGHGLSARQQELATVMIRNSDNDAADALWGTIGAAAGLAATNPVFGLASTTPATGSWGLTTTTAADQVALLDAIADPAGPLGTDSPVVLDLMATVADDQRWGVSAAARDGEGVQLKNGWMSRSNAGGTWTVNTIGRVTGPDVDLTVAILSRRHANLATGIALVERIAALARATLDPPATTGCRAGTPPSRP